MVEFEEVKTGCWTYMPDGNELLRRVREEFDVRPAPGARVVVFDSLANSCGPYACCVNVCEQILEPLGYRLDEDCRLELPPDACDGDGVLFVEDEGNLNLLPVYASAWVDAYGAGVWPVPPDGEKPDLRNVLVPTAWLIEASGDLELCVTEEHEYVLV